MGLLKKIAHKVEVVLGTDEKKSVADEAAEELAKQAKNKDDKGGEK
jgi:hypothetical protein